MENFIVTFARGFGTGGKEIASMLAKDLGIHCYENRILTLASQMSGLDEKLFLDINERIRNNGGFTGFLKGLPRSRQYIARNEKFVSDDRLFEYQSQIIRNLADQESCVIVGKCADYVLKGSPIPGFVGELTLENRLEGFHRELADALLCFAPFSGVGIKTTLGMGGVEHMDHLS